jgi:hypothetical protein
MYLQALKKQNEQVGWETSSDGVNIRSNYGKYKMEWLLVFFARAFS